MGLAGLSLAFAGSRSERARRARPIALALLGAGVSALGSVAVFGYVLTMGGVWAAGGVVPLPTAAGLVTLGVGILSVRFPREGAPGVRPRTIAVAVGTIAAAMLMAQALQRSERHAVSQRLWDRARAVARYVEDRMTSAVDATEAWASYAKDASDPAERARSQARAVLDQVSGARAVAWMEPGPRVVWTVTAHGTTVDPVAIANAMGTKPRPSSILVRLPGTEHFLVAAPVRGGDAPLGTLAVVVDLRRRVASQVVETLGGDDDVFLEEGGRRAVALTRAEPADAALPVGTSPLRPRGAVRPWALAIRSRAPVHDGTSPLPWITLLGPSIGAGSRRSATTSSRSPRTCSA
jgi:hypothetical protein